MQLASVFRADGGGSCVLRASLAMNMKKSSSAWIGLRVRMLLFMVWTTRADTRLLILKEDNA
jgi:hypothetical protein